MYQNGNKGLLLPFWYAQVVWQSLDKAVEYIQMFWFLSIFEILNTLFKFR